MSGVAVGEECVKCYEAMKMGRKLKYATFKVNDTLTEIVVDKTGEPGTEFDEFVGQFPEKDCRYGIIDIDYEHDGCKKSRIVFVFWSPDTANIRSKMVYASSKEAMRRQLAGIMCEMQCNDISDLTMEEMTEKLLRI